VGGENWIFPKKMEFNLGGKEVGRMVDGITRTIQTDLRQ
jgi:hypothetical protein